MEINADEILSFVKTNPKYNGEVSEYTRSMAQLPDFVYSKFYTFYPDYKNIVTQGDCLEKLQVVSLPDSEITEARCVVLSSTCDVDQRNKRIFSSNILYAPIISLIDYKDLLRSQKNDDGERLYDDVKLSDHLDAIRKQKVSSIFYFPEGKYLEEEAILFFDTICSSDNEAISRKNLNERRIFSLSAYGWNIFRHRLTYYFSRLTDETVELRFKAS